MRLTTTATTPRLTSHPATAANQRARAGTNPVLTRAFVLAATSDQHEGPTRMSHTRVAPRLGARVLLLDPLDRVLLIHARDPDDPGHHW